ncbi:MAG TPA: PelD GGDEF domain-containing protein, partial [Fluviicoccus sp.]|nr:PelD GGDEF domain-containing protein [Fluviicoccus sp.]
MTFITLITLLTASILSPADPLWTSAGFPWLWLTPAILAMRYGSIAALGSAGIFFLEWSLLQRSGAIQDAFPGQYFLGGLILTLIAGQFADVWITRFKRNSAANRYLRQRLVSLTRSHYLLRFSHERLEQDLLTKPVTLRDSLLHLRLLVLEEPPGNGGLPAVDELMRILTQACQLEVASLHRDVRGSLQLTPSAALGAAQALDLQDPLVRHAMQHRELCHIQTTGIDNPGSRYLVVAPLMNADGERIGLLAVERMPFLSLNSECLQFLGVTLGYYADTASQLPGVRDLLRMLPECPLQFASELYRLERVQRECRMDSTVVALVFEGGAAQKHLLDEAARQHQQLDVSWIIQGSGRHILITLLPLFAGNAVPGYLGRIEKQLQAQFGGGSLAESGIRHRSAQLGQQPAAVLITGL